MGSACTKAHGTSENCKYSVQKRLDDSYPGKLTFRVSCSFYKTCQSNGSRRSQFVYKYMKNVLCVKRMRVIQLPSQFLFKHWFIFAKISVLRFQGTQKDPQSLIAFKGSVFKLFLTPKVALDMLIFVFKKYFIQHWFLVLISRFVFSYNTVKEYLVFSYPQKAGQIRVGKTKTRFSELAFK